jgi:hypothetical protein
LLKRRKIKMANEPNKPNDHAPAQGDKLNKARAEFQKYRQRMQGAEQPRPFSPMGSAATAGPSTAAAMPAGGAFPGAYVAGSIPPWPAQPMGSPASMPQGMPFMPQPMPGFGPSFQGGPAPFAGSGPFFESVGKMLQMGVAFATMAFAGGTQMMQGFSGMPGGYRDDCCQPRQSRHHGCCEDDHHHRDECCEPAHDCCCNPGINNCDCC